jgi:xylulokinase
VARGRRVVAGGGRAAVGGERVAAPSALSGQMHGMVARDAVGRRAPPGPALERPAHGRRGRRDPCRVGRSRLIERTGNPAVTGFQLPKVLWLRRHEPDRPSRRATRHHAAEGRPRPAPDGRGGGRTVRRLRHRRLPPRRRRLGRRGPLGARPRPRDCGRGCVASDAVVGGLRRSASASAPACAPTRPSSPAPATTRPPRPASRSGRAHAEIGSVSLGTSGVLQVPLAEPTPDPDGRVHLFAHADGGYLLLGVTLAAAGSLRWYRDTFAPGRPYDALVAEAAGGAGRRQRRHLQALPGRRAHAAPARRPARVVPRPLAGDHARRRGPERARGRRLLAARRLDVMAPLTRPSAWLATGGGAASDAWLTMLADALGCRSAVPSTIRGGRSRSARPRAPRGSAGAPSATRPRASRRVPTTGSSPIEAGLG